MKKHIYEEKTGLWYEVYKSYYLPCLTLSEKEYVPSAYAAATFAVYPVTLKGTLHGVAD